MSISLKGNEKANVFVLECEYSRVWRREDAQKRARLFSTLGNVAEGEGEEGRVGVKHVRDARVVCNERRDDAEGASCFHDGDVRDELADREHQERHRQEEEERDERHVRTQGCDAVNGKVPRSVDVQKQRCMHTYSMRNVKMNHVARKNPMAWPSWPAPGAPVAYASATPDPGIRIVAYDSQKPPYDENAARKTFLALVSRLSGESEGAGYE